MNSPASVLQRCPKYHPWLVAAVLRHRIRNLDRVREAAFFRCQRISGLELQDIAPPIRRIDLARIAILRFLLHRFLKPLCDRLGVDSLRQSKQHKHPSKNEDVKNMSHDNSRLESTY